MPRFADTHVFRAERFSLGIDRDTGEHFLSTPVSGKMHAVEFEAYFSITDGEYRLFSENPNAALDFLEDCRMARQQARRIA